VPKSRIRKKADFTPPPERQTTIKLSGGGRAWVAPLMLALFAIGLAWIVVYYVTETKYPVQAWEDWNILAGFGFIAGGFVVSTQWK
jgi:hypothetical protein